MKDGNVLPQILKLLREKASIVIVLPLQAPIDAVSAALALYLGLQKEGKQVSLACAEELNPDFMLPGQEQAVFEIQAPGDTLVVSVPIENMGVENITYAIENDRVNIVIKPEEGLEHFNPKNVQYSYKGGKPDLIVAMYAPTLDSLGELYSRNVDAFQGVEIINVDRHFTNANFGTVNFVEKQSPSMTQMVFDILKELKTEFDKDIATNLYAGLSTATNNFSAHTVNAQTFRMAALLLEKGAEKRAPRPLGGMRAPMGGALGGGMPMGGGMGGFGPAPAFPFDAGFDDFGPMPMPARQPQAMPAAPALRPQQQPQRPVAKPQPAQQAAQAPQQPASAAPRPQPQEDQHVGTAENKEMAPQDLPLDDVMDEAEAENFLKPKIFQGQQGGLNPMQGGSGTKA